MLDFLSNILNVTYTTGTFWGGGYKATGAHQSNIFSNLSVFKCKGGFTDFVDAFAEDLSTVGKKVGDSLGFGSGSVKDVIKNVFKQLNSIGGMLKHIKSITAILNPTVNSYKRLVPGFEAPVYMAWSLANRSALLRVPAKRGVSTRVELRSPDPACNPYLAFATILAACLDGVRNKIEPPKPVDANIYKLSEKERKRMK